MTESASNSLREGDEVDGRSKESLCQSCLRKDNRTIAEKFCLHCNEFQCTDCSSVHNMLAILKSHKLVNAKIVYASRISFDLKELYRCGQHKKHFEFFCEDENKFCCSTCAIDDHRKCHSVVEVEKIVGKVKSFSSSLRERLQAAKNDADDITVCIQKFKDELDKDVNEIPRKIKQMRDKVMRMFDELEVTIVKKVETFQRETLDILTEKQYQNEKHLAYLTEWLETIDSIYNDGTAEQKCIADQKMESAVNDLCRNVKEEHQNLKTVTISFDFDDSLKLPPQPVSEYVPGQLTLEYHLLEKVKSVTNSMAITSISSTHLMKANDDITEPLYTGIDFLPDGRLIAVDNNNKKCLVYNEKLEKVGSYQFSYPPQSVVVVTEEDVAITSGNQFKLEFLHVSKSSQITLKRMCLVNSKLDSISVKDDTQFVTGSYDNPLNVRFISFNGKEADCSVNFPNKIYPLNKSACTFIKGSDKVVITDRDENTVYIYDIKTNLRVVVKDDKIQEPRGVAVDPSNTILVCCKGNNSIVQISQTGQILSSTAIDMKCPNKACVSRDKSFLVVTNSCPGSKKIQKFKFS